MGIYACFCLLKRFRYISDIIMEEIMFIGQGGFHG